MQPDAHPLAAVARAIAERSPVDWAEADSLAGDDSFRQILRELKVIAAIADLHERHEIDTGAERWGSFTLLEHIGRGSFGDVYRALDTRLDREVALKLMRLPDTGDGSRDTAVIGEARLLARIRHPNVVTIHGADRIEGRVGLWMELLRGQTLEQRLREHGPLSATEVARIGREICGALAAVHESGLLHRDIKAQNVLQEPDGRVVLMDFGAGHDLGDGDAVTLAGTPLYLAPELLEGKPASVQSDIYSVGVLLYHLLTGDYPVRGRTVREIRDKQRAGWQVSLGSVNAPALRGVLTRALRADPAARYATAAEMAAALSAAHPFRRRAMVAAAVCASVLLTGGYFARSTPPVSDPAPRIEVAGPGPNRVQACQNCGDELGFMDRGRVMFTDRSRADSIDLATFEPSTGKYQLIYKRVSPPETHRYSFAPVMSSDRRIAVSWHAGTRVQLQVLADPPDSEPLVLLDDVRYREVTPVGWSQDNRSVLAMVERHDGSADLVWISLIDKSRRRLKSLSSLEAVNGRPALSPDGRYVTYAALAGSPVLRDASVFTPEHIFLLGANDWDGTPTEIASDQDINGSPIWFDNTHVLFVNGRAPTVKERAVCDLRIVAVNGPAKAQPLVLWPEIACRSVLHGLSPSKTLYFTQRVVHEESKILPMQFGGRRVDESQPYQAIKGSLPSWSSDGESVATKVLPEGRDGGDPDTLVYRLGSETPKTFSRQGMAQTQTRWLPQGTNAFLETIHEHDADALYRVSLEGGQFNKVLDYDPLLFTGTMGLFSQLSRDGETLYMFGLTQPHELFAVNLMTKQKILIATLPKPGFGMKLSPDGNSLAIAAFDRAGTYLGRVDLHTNLYNEVHELRDIAASQIRPMMAWTSDSDEILYVQEDMSSLRFTAKFAEDILLRRSRGRGLSSPSLKDARRAESITRQTVMRAAADTSTPPEPVGIEVNEGRVQEISVSKDGSHLAYGLRTDLRHLMSLDLSEALQHLSK